MGEYQNITPPANAEDQEGAQRVFEEFLVQYHPMLMEVSQHLDQLVGRMEPAYAAAYKPWQKALKDLCQGVYLTAKKIPLPDPEAFTDALRMFCFDSAIQFLCDLCVSCKIRLQRDWGEKFREHINLLLFSIAVLNRQAQPALAR